MRNKYQSPAKRAARAREIQRQKRQDDKCEKTSSSGTSAPTPVSSSISAQCVVRGTHHQGHHKYGGASGKQCTCASFLFFMNLLLVPDVSIWTAEMLDSLILHGSGLYLNIVRSENYLLITELPTAVSYRNSDFKMNVFPAVSGCMNLSQSDPPYFSIEDAIQTSFLQTNSIFFTVGSNTMAIVKCSQTEYIIFDSHSRDSHGLCVAIGRSVLLNCPSLNSVCEVLKCLATSLGQPQALFECTPVVIVLDASAFPGDLTIIEECTLADIRAKSVENLFHGSANMQKYFVDQHKRCRKVTSENMQSAQPQDASRDFTESARWNEERLSSQRLRKRVLREKANRNMTEEEREERRKSERSRISSLREKHGSEMTEEEIEQRRKSERSRISSLREKQGSEMTEEEIEERRKSERSRISSLREKQGSEITEEERAEKRRTEQTRKSHLREKKGSEMTEEEIEERRKSERSRISSLREKQGSEITEEERAEKRRTEQTRKSRLREKKGSEMTEEEIEERRRNEQSRISSLREKQGSEMTEEERAEKRRTEQTRKRVQRKESFNRMSQQTSQNENIPYLTPIVIHSLNNFKQAISSGPIYPCACCHRTMYRRSVVHYKNRYSAKYLVNKCITNITDKDGKQWVCNSCHASLRKGKMPCQSQANSLTLCAIPEEMTNLSLVESHLIAKILPFMKIVSKPRGAQHGLKGSVVLVPANLNKIMTTLPRALPNAGIITLALKRRLSDTHAVHKQFINPSKVNGALQYLLQHNQFYSDVTVNEFWESQSCDSDPVTWAAATSENPNEVEQNSASDSDVTDSEDEVEAQNPQEFQTLLKQKRSVNSKVTCMHPTHGPDIGSDKVINIAPGEGSHPISISTEPNWEAMAFPSLFPDGKNTFANPVSPRTVPLTPKKYINNRLLSVDGRFGESTQYIFQALHWQEVLSLKSNVSIALRKQPHSSISASQLKDPSRIQRLISEDQVFSSFKTIRGTPQYWHAMQLDMLAKVRQFGSYTFFLTGSSAEFQWIEVIQAVAQQYGHNLSEDMVNDMSWQEKRSWLERNPVTVARHIDLIFEQVWGKVILGGAHPIGQILTYDRRMEMQGRGTAHWHSAILVKDAPRVDVQTNEEVVTFVDKYISCTTPDITEDPELHHLVTSRQTHHHTASCKKNRRDTCRFGYPKPPTENTLLSRRPQSEMSDSLVTLAREILSKVMDVLQTPFLGTLEELLTAAGVTLAQYELALRYKSKKTTLVMKRTPQDIHVNNYNPVILTALKSNMDIQFITDVWACIAYLCSYMCKPERSMSETMKKASKEASSKSIADQLFSIGQVFLKCREVSEHEAVARLLPLPMRRSDLEVIYVATDFKPNRTRMLKPLSVIAAMEDDDDDIYLPSIHSKYAARPASLDEVCFAEFVTSYCMKSKSQDEDVSTEVDEDVGDTTITLQHGMGKMRKRRRPAVLRYHYVSREKDSEQYHHRLLLLYLPWRVEESLKHQDESYESRFEEVHDQITSTIKKYEPYTEEVETILEDFNPEDVPVDIWDELAGEREQDLLENVDVLDSRFAGTDPINLSDQQESNQTRQCQVERNVSLMPDDEYFALISTLNQKQRDMFDFIHDWSVQMKFMEIAPDPFYVFLSGEGGTGKSHLIHAVYQCVEKTLRQSGQDPSKPIVLLTAPTGKAATNINGTTLHSAFPLPIRDNFSKLYKKPSSERLAKLRNLYSLLKIIVVDEISMVGGTTLEHLSLALQDITEEHIPFGGVSILAVGDLLQLNPVGDRAVFQSPRNDYQALYGSLWARHFLLHELSEVIRQRGDPGFRDILSRVRTGTVTDDDVHALKQLENNPSTPEDAVHLFITNKMTETYNASMIDRLPETFTIKAKDSSKDLLTGTDVYIQATNIHETGNLTAELKVALQARFMLTRNLDTSDMLVNGAMGTIVELQIPKERPLSGIIFVCFDNEMAGMKARRQNPRHLRHAVPIRAVTARFLISRSKIVTVERTQYPGVLAWAVTVHKAQGSTYTSMVGDLTIRKHTPIMQGLVYTMLSRATSRDGLNLIGFEANKIKVNKSALAEMERLQRDTLFTWSHPLSCVPPGSIVIGVLNVRSLRAHHQHLLSEDFLKQMTVLGLTETRVAQQQTHQFNFLPTHSSTFKATDHGLAMLTQSNFSTRQLQITSSIEIMANIVFSTSRNILVVVIYRRPGAIGTFLHSLEENLNLLPHDTLPTVVMGDFNMNNLRPLVHLMSAHNFQLIRTTRSPTHLQGGQLDLLFTNREVALPTTPVPVYFTDHFLIFTAFSDLD